MVKRPHRYLWLALLGLTLSCASTSVAQMRPASTLRSDTVWSGQVEITQDVSIIEAELRIEAGTTVRFIGQSKTGRGPVIRLATPLFAGDERARPARLTLAGRSDRPVIFETPEGSPPGAIEATPGSTSAIDARFVTFRRLGTPLDVGTCRPAILVQLTAMDNDLWLTDCRFEACGALVANIAGPDAGVEITRCTFTNTCGATALRLSGAGTGVKVIRECVADAGFEIATPQVLMRGNVLVGPLAEVKVRRSAGEGVAVVGNYIHCTTDQDIGRYALRCEAAATVVRDNVLAGGSYVMETAPRRVERNVIIGAGNLRARLDAVTPGAVSMEIRTMTHALVTNICPDAVLADNLLLGPAYAAVAVTERCAGLRIAGNVFDGWGAARRALEFDVTATGTGSAFVENIITGYTQTPVLNAAATDPSLEAHANRFVAKANPLYQGFPSSRPSGDRDQRFAGMAELGHGFAPTQNAPSTQAAAGADDLLTSRRKTVAEVHRQWFDVYPRPRNPEAGGRSSSSPAR